MRAGRSLLILAHNSLEKKALQGRGWGSGGSTGGVLILHVSFKFVSICDFSCSQLHSHKHSQLLETAWSYLIQIKLTLLKRKVHVVP